MNIIPAYVDSFDVSLIDISDTFGVFDNIIVRIDQSLNTFKTDIASNLSTINSHNSTHLNNHSTLSSTITTLSDFLTKSTSSIVFSLLKT